MRHLFSLFKVGLLGFFGGIYFAIEGLFRLLVGRRMRWVTIMAVVIGVVTLLAWQLRHQPPVIKDAPTPVATATP